MASEILMTINENTEIDDIIDLLRGNLRSCFTAPLVEKWKLINWLLDHRLGGNWYTVLVVDWVLDQLPTGHSLYHIDRVDALLSEIRMTP
jgi:hypothetical protein